jgi:hypothetical protein
MTEKSARITIKSSTLTPEQRNHPNFAPLLAQEEKLFNSDAYRLRVSLHEAGHVIYMRAAGATKIIFYGPEIIWDARFEKPAISRSSVVWTPPVVDSVAVALNLKPFIGGIVFRERLSVPNDAEAIERDMFDARQWFDTHVGRTGNKGFDDARFEVAIEEAREEIIRDLRSPAFKKKAWETAREFSREVFRCD